MVDLEAERLRQRLVKVFEPVEGALEGLRVELIEHSSPMRDYATFAALAPGKAYERSEAAGAVVCMKDREDGATWGVWWGAAIGAESEHTRLTAALMLLAATECEERNT